MRWESLNEKTPAAPAEVIELRKSLSELRKETEKMKDELEAFRKQMDATSAESKNSDPDKEATVDKADANKKKD